MTADGLFWTMLFAAWCLYLAVSAAITESLIPWIKKRPAGGNRAGQKNSKDWR